MIQKLLREPLVHFAALGAAVFIAYGLVAPPAVENSEIIVSADRIASLTAQFSTMYGGRPPTEAERRRLTVGD